MLYLEDFLDLIESLPMEMREKLTEVRELDLQVQNGLDNLSERSKNFFRQCSEARIVGQPRTEEYQKILSQYDDLLQIADDKVHLANNLYTIVQRFVSKLDQELLKFKMELEADNAGITEVLERRSKELDVTSHSRSDRRVLLQDGRSAGPMLNHHAGSTHHSLHNHSSLDIDTTFDLSSFAFGLGADSFDSFTPAASGGGHSSGGLAALLSNGPPGSPAAVSEDLSMPSSAAPSSVSGDRKRPRANQGGRRLSTAAANPGRLQSHQNMRPVASSGSLTGGRGGRRARRGTGGGSNSTLAVPLDFGSSNSPASVSSESLFGSIMDTSQGIMVDRPHHQRRGGSSGSLAARGGGSTANDDDEDGAEMRWCLCNDVSYGEMIMCDNKDCPIEWFHYGCVHITSAPRGRWYCPQCAAAMKRRGSTIAAGMPGSVQPPGSAGGPSSSLTNLSSSNPASTGRT